MFQILEKINQRPPLCRESTTQALWTDDYRARQMLAFHLNPDIDVSSRKATFIQASADWMADHFSLRTGVRVCDFGCGPGLHTSLLAQSGAKVRRFDYIHADYLEAPLTGTYDLITIIMCDFCALSPDQQAKLLAVFDKILHPDGKILLDVCALAAFNVREEAGSSKPSTIGFNTTIRLLLKRNCTVTVFP